VFSNRVLHQLILECVYEEDMNEKLDLLYRINGFLPKRHRIKLPLYVTNDYIDKLLMKIKESLLKGETISSI